MDTNKLNKLNETLIIDDMPELHFGDIVKVNQDGLALLKQADQAADQPIENDAFCAELNTAGKILSHNRNIIEKLRVETKKPYLDGGRKIDVQFNIALDQFDRVINKTRKAVTGYTQEKQRKLQEAQAEVERKNREAAEAARKEEERRINISKAQGGTGKNVKPVEAEVIAAPIAKIDVSGTTTVTKWKAVVVDSTKVPDEILKDSRVTEAMRIVAQEMVNENKKDLRRMASIKDLTPIAGIEVREEQNARF